MAWRRPGCGFPPACWPTPPVREQPSPARRRGRCPGCDPGQWTWRKPRGAHETAVAFLHHRRRARRSGRCGSPPSTPGSGWRWPGRCASDEAVTAARAAAGRTADAEGPPPTPMIPPKATSWSAERQQRPRSEALPGACVGRSARNAPWAALTLLALDHKEAADPGAYRPSARPAQAAAGAGPSCTGRRGWFAELTSPVPVAPSTAGGRTFRQGGGGPYGAALPDGRVRPALPVFEGAAARPAPVASWRGRSTAGPASRARAALGDLGGARWRPPRQVNWLRISGTGWSWERIHVVARGYALALATARTGPGCRRRRRVCRHR